ncbi:antirepressor [Lactobacillus coryniformis subsp. torquens DSM = KCTC 3535] [Lactiplantibacillus mudanjiangensis]|uniref:ORF6N domain-containing protein n=1 Tax=Lactiplantibacillus mudanjiangensis TaxID=1296538 RepID=UPI001014D5B3|nr:antirepressor [Lactobacillus coryniformis subsp. torquens DSM = KCTC 3535] [Lactiplantibacillus mudanjiangensis]
MNNPQRVKHNGDLILTTEQLAKFYGTSTKRIMENYSRNKERFIDGKHFYYLEGPALKQFKDYTANSGLVDKHAPSAYLWTKRGASRHSKMLGTDRAWDMFDELEETYFSPARQNELALTTEQQVHLLATNGDRANKRIGHVEDEIKDLQDNQTIAPGEYNYISHQVGSAVKSYISAHPFVVTSQQRAKLYRDINRGLNEVTGIKTRTQLRRKDFDTADEFISNWKPSTATIQIIKQLSGEVAGQTDLEIEQSV